MQKVPEGYKKMLKEHYEKLDNEPCSATALREAIKILETVPKDDVEKNTCEMAIKAINLMIPEYFKDRVKGER